MHSLQRDRIKRAHIEEVRELDHFYSSVVCLHHKHSSDMYAVLKKKQQRDLSNIEKSLDGHDKQLNSSAEILKLN
jgi:hypothetical protein